MKKTIRVVSLNASMFDSNNDQLSRFFKEIEPDIVCLQEITRKVDSCAYEQYITKDILDSSLPHLSYSFYAPNFALSEYRKKNFHGKKEFYHNFGGVIESGNYIKSRFFIYEGHSIEIKGHFSYITDWKDPKKQMNLSRMIQLVDIRLSDKIMLSCLNYHGIWSRYKNDSEATISASKKIINLTMNQTNPTIICGDFNLFPNTKSITILNNKFNNLINQLNIKTTRPSSNELNHHERNVVDYIFVSNNISVHNFKVIDSDVSDHFPLVLDFSLNL